MIVTFSPVDGEPRRYVYDPDTLPNPETFVIEDLTGKTWLQAQQDIEAGGQKARTALVYCFEKRTHPSLSWDAFVSSGFPAGAIEVEYTREELEARRRAIADSTLLPAAQQAQALAALDVLMEDAPEAPKAPEPRGLPAT